MHRGAKKGAKEEEDRTRTPPSLPPLLLFDLQTCYKKTKEQKILVLVPLLLMSLLCWNYCLLNKYDDDDDGGDFLSFWKRL